MRHFAMKSTKGRSRGFTLIASLMLMLLMSAVAVGLLMMVNTESRVGNSDLENNAAYHSAEGAMEKMAADLNGMYASILAPQVGDIQNLSSLAPNNDPMVTYPEYSLTPHTKVDANGNVGPDTGWGRITAGAYKDLYAQILQVDLKATAERRIGRPGQHDADGRSRNDPRVSVRSVLRQRSRVLQQSGSGFRRSGAHQWRPIPRCRQRQYSDLSRQDHCLR